MKWNLPRLTWELDCEPLGYPGLTVVFWLNIDIDTSNVPSWANIEDEETRTKAVREADAWDAWPYFEALHAVESIRIPARYLHEAQGDQEVRFASAKEVWEFEHVPGFDPQILQWAMRQYRAQRQERLKVASKN
jgi:hypothetical protein